jgi:hypothetical protein
VAYEAQQRRAAAVDGTALPETNRHAHLYDREFELTRYFPPDVVCCGRGLLPPLLPAFAHSHISNQLHGELPADTTAINLCTN